MKKKRVSFASVPRPLSPTPPSSTPSLSSLSSVCLSPCPPQAPNSGPRSVRPPVPPPHQIKFPSVVSKPPPTLADHKANRLHRSPLSATISPALNHPGNCPRGQESLPQGTAQRFRGQTPAVHREQNTVGRNHRVQDSQGYSRFPSLTQATRTLTGQNLRNPRSNSSVRPADASRLRVDGRKLAGFPHGPRKAR
ncbi:hypothetical protein HJG60_010627 [Phyllostomus discolor]|uniref:Uncharacterized protein n=1 Tax=Phyllostomus discolor TaxID=89673 RepID=A0A834APQ7_9CHIR|nr:hypothetical protein HJG60_010627 [Phyllostomus discolor]